MYVSQQHGTLFLLCMLIVNANHEYDVIHIIHENHHDHKIIIIES